MSKTVTCEISTKGRLFTSLPLAIESVLNQTKKPDNLVIISDDETEFNPTTDPLYKKLFKFLNLKEINWYFLFGKRKGQVYNHQDSLMSSNVDYIWRLDDDDIAEPNLLEKLLSDFESDDNIAAVGGIVRHDDDNFKVCPSYITGKIEDIFLNQHPQWYRHEKPDLLDVDHLYSTFVYRVDYAKRVGGYYTDLSCVSHREETFFTYKLKAAGHRLLVDPTVCTDHLRLDSGGIRTCTSEEMWLNDEQKFIDFLRKNNVYYHDFEIVVLVGGIGDHYAFKSIYPEFKAKNLNKKILIFCAYPEVFWNLTDVTILSVADAQNSYMNTDMFDIYKWMYEHDWKNTMCEAYKKMYNL